MNSNLITSFLTQKHRWMRLIGLDKQQVLSNMLNEKLQSKELSTEQLKTSLAISWSINECIKKNFWKRFKKTANCKNTCACEQR